jgi:hypothetical protein
MKDKLPYTIEKSAEINGIRLPYLRMFANPFSHVTGKAKNTYVGHFSV